MYGYFAKARPPACAQWFLKIKSFVSVSAALEKTRTVLGLNGLTAMMTLIDLSSCAVTYSSFYLKYRLDF